VRHSHQRNACTGGSPALPDPLVQEIAETASMDRQSLATSHELAPAPLANEPADVDELAQIDEQLRIAARESESTSTETEPPTSPDPAVLMLMARVQLPTLRALSTASLQPLRAVIRTISHEGDAQLLAACHVLLGSALKLRADRIRGPRRARLLIEGTRAFDVAYSVYAALRVPATIQGLSVAQAHYRQADDNGSGRHRPQGYCVAERDGTSLIARAVTGAGQDNTHLLERAVMCLRLARAGADIKSGTWVSTTNNLACALTLLGNRIPARTGSAMLEEAARVLHEVLAAHADGHLREDRGHTLVNLAEALLSMAERETPGMRVAQAERAFMASSSALRSVVPRQLAWLVAVERRELE
jgi:hypothetical protein